MSDFFYSLPAGEDFSNDGLGIFEKPSVPYGEGAGYTSAQLAEKLGSEEWFLAYTIQTDGAIEGLNESSTYSLSISPDGRAFVKNYTLTQSPATGKLFTVEDLQPGTWKMSGRLFTIELEDETLEFLVTGIEHGVAQMVDAEYNTASVFMTGATFKVALKFLFDD